MVDPLQAFRAAILAALGHAPEVIEPGRFQRFATSERRGDFAGDDLSRQAAQRAAVEIADKAFASLRAKVALAGFTVHLIDDGGGGCAYLVSRWAQYRTFADRDALAAFAKLVGVPA